MVRTLADDDVGASTHGFNVGLEIWQVHPAPDLGGQSRHALTVENAKASIERLIVIARLVAKPDEPGHVPRLLVRPFRIQINQRIEGNRGVEAQAFDEQDVEMIQGS